MKTSAATWCSALLPLALLVACASGTPTTPTAPFTPSSSAPLLTIAPVPTDLAPYNRDEWSLWTDADGDCQDTRAEVLIEESVSLRQTCVN